MGERLWLIAFLVFVGMASGLANSLFSIEGLWVLQVCLLSTANLMIFEIAWRSRNQTKNGFIFASIGAIAIAVLIADKLIA